MSDKIHIRAEIHTRTGGPMKAEYFPPGAAGDFITLEASEPVIADTAIRRGTDEIARIHDYAEGTVFFTVEQAEEAIARLTEAVNEAKAARKGLAA